ncbi:hypothetical protein V1514DRAFT_335090 [Lipomyces japonicus]|uniref:uncharacterized protein n=1 Tax=Lipomyces japonicus TaxID=56871 RepID=UPI0034CDF738
MAASIPSTQSGILIPQKGGREVIKYKTDLPVPKPGPKDVLVKIAYAGLNFIDSYFRSGLYPASYPYIAGRDGAGTVVAVGPEVQNVKIGDRVGLFKAFGVFSEYTVADAADVYVLPDDISFETAAASLIQGLTALSLVKDAYEVKKGDYILVQAAAGGVGLLLVQLVKSLGAHAIGTVSTPEKAELAKQAGAEYVLNYKANTGYVNEILKITNGKGVEAVFDGVGQATFEDSFAVVRRKGTLVTFGNASGPVPPLSVARLSQKNLKLLRPTLYNYITEPEEREFYINWLWRSIRDGSLNIKIFKVYSLKDYAQAAHDLEERVSTGKLILKIE